ncbi:MAG TPA: acyl-CoA thioesterase domain-containing protein [Acidimicrobiales bacterium]|nr:acyl-CoA thioesterase domain-containing protein [Acidimicrobiales bacterium]
MTDTAPPPPDPARLAARFERWMAMFDLEPDGDDAYLAPTPAEGEGPPRLFGGQVAAQSLRAATLTVDGDRPPHSLHAYFLRPGRPGVPLRLEVERTRDGRSFATRTVHAVQDDETVLLLTCSFHGDEPGDDWHRVAPDVPGPDEVAHHRSPMASFDTVSPFEMRPVHPPRPDGFPVLHPFWVRTRLPVPDDAVLHRCLIAFLSDMGVVMGARAPESTLPARFLGASLDHAVWFHRPARPDEWLLFSVEPASNSGARGLALGSFRTVDGTLVASIAQEALLRDSGRVPLP